MKTYNETIVQATKENYFNINMNVFLCNMVKEADTWQDVEEYSFMNFNLSVSQYYKFKDLYDNEGMLKQAMNYIIEKTKIEKENIDVDSVESDILHACDTAYSDDYMTKMFKYTKEKLLNIIEKTMLNIEYEILYYSKEDKTLHDELKYNTSEVRIYFNNSEIEKIRKELSVPHYTDDEVIDKISYEVSFNPIDYTHFDYYGTVADYDEWFEAFKDCEETSYTILNEREKKIKQLKNKIKNKVELIYR